MCKHNNIKLKLLMIGPLPPPIGGISVSFKIMLDCLKSNNDVSFESVDFNAIRNKNGNSISGLFILCKEIILKAQKADIITVYFASPALYTFGLLLLILSRIMGKPLVIRKAAGFDYFKFSFLKARIAHFVIKHTDLFLAQTKQLVDLANARGISHVKWFPTNRPGISRSQSSLNIKKICRRFVYVGQIREYKGIREIIQASERFDDEIQVAIYGPLFNDFNENYFAGYKRVKYYGALSPECVIPTLSQYDMLLLPTKAITEGYPGVIFEAYSAGLPVITTHCGGIVEIVDNESGLFVRPGDSEDLYNAMKTVIENDSIYCKLQKGAFKKSKEFDAQVWTNHFVEYCKDLL